MTNPFVDKAKEEMGTIERLLKGLPIIRGYVNKELRRDADFRLRQILTDELNAEKGRLYAIQQKLLSGGGLRYLEDVDKVIQKLQTLADRVRTASYGYAGLFNAVRIREEQLDALHRFDVALANRTYEIREGIDALGKAIESKEGISAAIDALDTKLTEFGRLFDQRHRAVEDPDFLTKESAPAVSEEWMQAADQYGTKEK
ncbi:MAG: hypothetical protein KF893_01180 [Caldilineaceae bacterium]|nr:hypothetical protein [Caldilineaceae bacterium]